MVELMTESFTVHLTRGSFVVDITNAERVLAAVEAGEAHVAVMADRFGDGLVIQPVRIVTAHVVSVAANPTQANRAPGQSPLLSVVSGGRP